MKKYLKISVNRKNLTARIRNTGRRGEILTHQPSLLALEGWAEAFNGYRPAIEGRDEEEWQIINK